VTKKEVSPVTYSGDPEHLALDPMPGKCYVNSCSFKTLS
jgi:hypothetical protein